MGITFWKLTGLAMMFTPFGLFAYGLRQNLKVEKEWQRLNGQIRGTKYGHTHRDTNGDNDE